MRTRPGELSLSGALLFCSAHSAGNSYHSPPSSRPVISAPGPAAGGSQQGQVAADLPGAVRIRGVPQVRKAQSRAVGPPLDLLHQHVLRAEGLPVREAERGVQFCQDVLVPVLIGPGVRKRRPGIHLCGEGDPPPAAASPPPGCRRARRPSRLGIVSFIRTVESLGSRWCAMTPVASVVQDLHSPAPPPGPGSSGSRVLRRHRCLRHLAGGQAMNRACAGLLPLVQPPAADRRPPSCPPSTGCPP